LYPHCLFHALILLRGGGGGKHPVTPNDPGKTATDFLAAWDIYGWDPTLDGGSPNYFLAANGVDVAPLVWGSGQANPGNVVCFPTSESSSFVATVSQVTDVFNQTSQIELKFFTMWQVGQQWLPVMYVPSGSWILPHYNQPESQYRGWTVSLPGEQPQNPRVILHTTASQALNYIDFEVVVAYEVTNPSRTLNVYHGNFTLLNASGWVYLLQNMPNPSWEPVSDTGDTLFPDIEFCPAYANGGTGDLTHLVYVNYEQGGNPDASIMHRQRYVGSSFGAADNLMAVGESDVNGWIPRIDVGTVTDPYGFTSSGLYMTVAVVYTRQQVDPVLPFPGFRSYAFYWYEPEGPWGGSNHRRQAVINGFWEPGGNNGNNPCDYYGSGMPVIDIAPESNANHDAYVAFTQQITCLPDAIRYGVYMVGDALNQPTFPFVTVSNDADNAVLPAICVHQGLRQMSITYYDQAGGPSFPWEVLANRVDYFDPFPVGGDNIIPTLAHGSFNLDDLQHFNYGVASGLASAVNYGQPSYCAAWSDAVGAACEPCHVRLTFGFTNP
jgi:hypothetical protein